MRSLVTGLPPDLRFRTKGQLAIDVLADAYADGLSFDFACGDEVYGSCTGLREYLEHEGQAYVLRVASSFMLALAAETRMTCVDAVRKLLGDRDRRRWEVRSAGEGPKGDRWYAWAWIGTASPRHHLLVRRHLQTGELAFHYCYVPEGQLLTKARLIRAAGLRWPVEEDFEFGKDCFGLDQCQARLYTAIPATSCWSWPPWRSAQSPPPGSGTPPTPRPRHPCGQTSPRRPTPASSRSPSTR